MKQWLVLFKKEWLEMVRNYKIMWIPLVFILLGIMQPVTSYYMPQILEKAGNLPEGAVIKIPMPTGAEVLAQTLGQYNQMGVLILTLAFMGIVASEKTSGVAGMILVKPVRFGSFITAKWVSASIHALVSYLLGMGSSLYYTNLLIGSVDIGAFFKGSFTYAIWLIFIVTLTLFFSTILKSNGLVAFLTIGSTILLSALTSLLTKWMQWSPARLSEHASSLLVKNTSSDHFLLTISITVIFIVALLVLSIRVFSKKELIE